MKTLLKSLAFLAVATLAGTAFGYGIGDRFFCFNGTRYTGSSPYEESAGYADGAELGEITELTIGAEVAAVLAANATLPSLAGGGARQQQARPQWRTASSRSPVS